MSTHYISGLYGIEQALREIARAIEAHAERPAHTYNIIVQPGTGDPEEISAQVLKVLGDNG